MLVGDRLSRPGLGIDELPRALGGGWRRTPGVALPTATVLGCRIVGSPGVPLLRRLADTRAGDRPARGSGRADGLPRARPWVTQRPREDAASWLVEAAASAEGSHPRRSWAWARREAGNRSTQGRSQPVERGKTIVRCPVGTINEGASRCLRWVTGQRAVGLSEAVVDGGAVGVVPARACSARPR